MWFYRFSLEDGKYKVIKSPIDLAECKSDDVRSFLRRSEKGCTLQLFILWTYSLHSKMQVVLAF